MSDSLLESFDEPKKNDQVARQVELFVPKQLFSEIHRYMDIEEYSAFRKAMDGTERDMDSEQFAKVSMAHSESHAWGAMNKMIERYLAEYRDVSDTSDITEFLRVKYRDYLIEELGNLEGRFASKNVHYVLAETETGEAFFKGVACEDVLSLVDAFERSVERYVDELKNNDQPAYTYQGSLRAVRMLRTHVSSILKHDCNNEAIPQYNVDYSPL